MNFKYYILFLIFSLSIGAAIFYYQFQFDDHSVIQLTSYDPPDQSEIDDEDNVGETE